MKRRVTVQLTDDDMRLIGNIMRSIPEVNSVQESLLWALRSTGKREMFTPIFGVEIIKSLTSDYPDYDVLPIPDDPTTYAPIKVIVDFPMWKQLGIKPIVGRIRTVDPSIAKRVSGGLCIIPFCKGGGMP